MSYQALYRVWRPQQFKDVIGQDAITKTLKNALITGQTSHAYLFTGPRGTGKTSVAKILAKALNCLHLEDGEPDNTCEICQAINDGSLTDESMLRPIMASMKFGTFVTRPSMRQHEHALRCISLMKYTCYQPVRSMRY